MIALTQNRDSGDRLLGGGPRPWHRCDREDRSELGSLAGPLFGDGVLYRREEEAPGSWRHLLLVETAPSSHFDLLVDLARGGGLPDAPLLCLAGEGHGFHGMRGRPWVSAAGNLHLVAHFAPRRPLEAGAVALSAAAALAVVEALDTVAGLEGRAAIKWVNDILVGGAKVGGVLGHTSQSGEDVVSAVVGVGLDVEIRPEVEPTPYVPRVACVGDFAPCTVGQILTPLLAALDRHCRMLFEGGHRDLVEAYRRRSLVLGRKVRIDSESGEPIARGRVGAIGEHLELVLEGRKQPVSKGRLVLEDSAEGAAA